MEEVPVLPDKRAYGVTEAAEMYSVSKSWLWLQIRGGRLPVKRAGRRVLILDRDLVSFFEGDASAEGAR